MSRFLLFLVSALFSVSVAAQGPREERGRLPQYPQNKQRAGAVQCSMPDSICRMHARAYSQQSLEQKRIYYVSQMQLNEVQKVAFLSLYDEYESAVRASRRMSRSASESVTDDFTAEQYEAVVETIAEQSEKQAELREEFVEKLRKTFTSEQVYRFFAAERSFNRQLVRDFDCRQQNIKK